MSMPPETDESAELLSPKDAAAVLRVSPETLRRWAASGKIRHVALPSGRVRFRREDLAEVLEPVEPEVAAS